MAAIRRRRKKQEIMFNIDATYQAGAAGVWLNFSRPSPLKIIRPTEIRKFTAPPAIFYTDDFLAAPNGRQNRNGAYRRLRIGRRGIFFFSVNGTYEIFLLGMTSTFRNIYKN